MPHGWRWQQQQARVAKRQAMTNEDTTEELVELLPLPELGRLKSSRPRVQALLTAAVEHSGEQGWDRPKCVLTVCFQDTTLVAGAKSFPEALEAMQDELFKQGLTLRHHYFWGSE